MARSLKVAPEYINPVKSALQRNGYPSQKKFAEHVTPSLSTVKKFLNGEPVDFDQGKCIPSSPRLRVSVSPRPLPHHKTYSADPNSIALRARE